MRSALSNNQLALTVTNPDIYNAAWSTSARLNGIALLYRKAGTRTWTAATNANGSPVVFATTVAAVGHSLQRHM